MGTDIAASANPSLAVAIKYLYEWGVGLGGVAVFVSLIIAGFEYITSMGNPPKMQEAFNRIRDAVVGLVVLLSSYAILSLIGINLTNMKVNMFQANFNTPAVGCKSAEGSAAPRAVKTRTARMFQGATRIFSPAKDGTQTTRRQPEFAIPNQPHKNAGPQLFIMKPEDRCLPLLILALST